jgi:DNA-binding CsgD family transcriptional regulator/DNA-binding XRE family transcriptional regulator
MSEDWFFESLPLRPGPYAGECLSGYLLRVADLNGYTILWDLVGDLFPSWDAPQQINKLKWEYPLKDWGRIPLRTGLTSGELTRLTVAPWVEKFRLPPDLDRSIYLSPGHFLKSLMNPALRVCPFCLQSYPYLRLLWRLFPVTACLEHGCLLQERCSACGTTLTPVSQDHHHLRCPACGADFRSLSVTMASQDILNVQRHRQEDFCFLLDPAATIAKSNADTDPAYALGLKFHYLRDQAGMATKVVAQKATLSVETITAIEQGALVALRHHLSYLEALHLSWKEFAMLEVPDEFEQAIHTPRHMQLRLCPNPKCPKHHPPAGTSVQLLRDMPEQRIARFHCTTCDRRFTRSYDGGLRTKPPRPALRAGDPHILMKSQTEIATLIEMGLRGDSNSKIAQSLGWGEKTVRIYWIALGMEGQVHQAQAKRRIEEKLERYATLRLQIQATLDSMLAQNREVTLQQMSQTLGTKGDYWHVCCDQTDVVHEAIQQHNTQVRQRRDEVVSTRIASCLENLQCSDRIVKVEEIAKQAGISYNQLRTHYPELRLKIHAAIQAHRIRLKKIQIANQIQQIDDAATRLTAQGQRLNYKAILEAAGLSPYVDNSAPIRDALARWVSNFAPRD